MGRKPPSPQSKYERDRRPESHKVMDRKLKSMSFPTCYGHCPDVGVSCPNKDEFDKFLSEHKNICFNILPKNWECRTCIYGEHL